MTAHAGDAPLAEAATESRRPAGSTGGEDVLTVAEAAQLLKVGRNALYDAIGRGEVPHRRIGKNIRLSRAALMRWLGSWALERAEEQ